MVAWLLGALVGLLVAWMVGLLGGWVGRWVGGGGIYLPTNFSLLYLVDSLYGGSFLVDTSASCIFIMPSLDTTAGFVVSTNTLAPAS